MYFLTFQSCFLFILKLLLGLLKEAAVAATQPVPAAVRKTLSLTKVGEPG